MNKRPHSVTVISCLFLIAGLVGLAYHATEFKAGGPIRYELVWVCLVRLVAIICAVFLFRAKNWARWLLVIWIAYHVVLSAFHSPAQLIVHGLLLAAVAYFLFRPDAAAYFRGRRAESSRIPVG
jgi:formate hydrogenlyase subunit 3/multisubunit Na+/H+ antiporter MnhD subunit